MTLTDTALIANIITLTEAEKINTWLELYADKENITVRVPDELYDVLMRIMLFESEGTKH
jgi:hypothetical protein